MTDCTQWPAWIEADRHGALDDASAAELAEHLAGCEECRAYRDDVEAQERSLAEGADRARRTVDWPRLERRIARVHRRFSWQLAGSVAYDAVTLAAAIWFSPWFLLLLYYAVGTLLESREKLRNDRAEREGLTGAGEWLAYYRRQVWDRCLSAAFTDGLGSLAIAAFLGFLAIIGRYTVPVGIAAGVMALVGLYSIAFRARRLLREYFAIEPFDPTVREEPAA